MAASENTRQINPIILTDRIVADKAAQTRSKMEVEWLLTDDLYAIAHPIGYREIFRPVYVAVNNKQHLWAVESTAIALAAIANLDVKDVDCSNGIHRAHEARRAWNFVADTKKILETESTKKNIAESLYRKLWLLLDKAGGPPEPFSKRWEVAVILYAGIAAVGVPNCYESVFGPDSRSQDTVRQDKARGRTFVKSVLTKLDLECSDAPAPSVCIEITEKYLNAICPLMAPQIYLPKKIELKEVCSVTRRGGAVTKKREESTHEPNHRSSNRTSVTALPKGFFNNS